jgi:hypothetical protein
MQRDISLWENGHEPHMEKMQRVFPFRVIGAPVTGEETLTSGLFERPAP